MLFFQHLHTSLFIYIYFTYLTKKLQKSCNWTCYLQFIWRAIESFFMVRALSKNVGYHGWPMTKNLKLYWLKCHKQSQKKIATRKKMIQTSCLEFISLPINFRFSGTKSQSQQKLAKKITHFPIQFRSINLIHFVNLNSLNIIKNILQQHSQKTLFALYIWCVA